MGTGFVYVVSSSIDIMVVVNVVNGKLNVMRVAQGSLRSDELPAIVVVVRDGAVKDDEALWGRVVLAEVG